MKTTKRLLSTVLVVAMLFQILPAFAFAKNDSFAHLNAEDAIVETTDNTQDGVASLEKADSYVVMEMPALRTETRKHFRMSDGSFIAVDYNDTVHYRDSDGNWLAIDNSMKRIETSPSAPYYETRNGNEVRQFAAALNDKLPLLFLSGDDVSIKMSPLETKSANSESGIIAEVADFEKSYFELSESEQKEQPFSKQIETAHLSSEIKYSGVWEKVTLQYVVHGFDVKESIVIETPTDKSDFSFSMKAEGLTPSLQEDGSISFSDKQGTVLYRIPAPYMWDANDDYSDEVKYELSKDENDWILTISADKEWLSSPERAYPVTIDPTVYKEGNATNNNIITSYVNSNNEDTVSYQNKRFVRCGYYDQTAYDANCRGYTIGLIYINELPPLPVGCVPTEAYLNLYQIRYGGSSNYPKVYTSTINASYSSIESYLNGLTWDSFNSQIVYGNPNAAGERSAMDYFKTSSSYNGADFYWDISPAAQQWYGTAPSISKLLVLDDGHTGSTNARATYAGYDYDTDQTLHRPQIVVGYRSAVGEEGIYSYHSQQVGRAGTGNVNDYTLGLTFSNTLLSSPSEVTPFSLSLVYNSAYSNTQFNSTADILTKDYSLAKTGYGWKTSVQQTIVSTEITGNNNTSTTYLVYTDADGTQHYFKKSGTTWNDEDGLGLKITSATTSGNTIYTMEDTEKNSWEFYNGYLTEFSDSHENKLFYAYTNGFSSLSADENTWKPASSTGAHRVYSVWRKNHEMTDPVKIATLNYNNGYLYSVVDQAGRTTNITCSSGPLTSISYPDEVTINYEYTTISGQRLLTAASDNESGYRVEYAYLSMLGQERVNGVSEYARNVNNQWISGQTMRAWKAEASDSSWQYAGTDAELYTADDIVVHYKFDKYGRTVNIAEYNSDKSKMLGVSAGSYTENTGTSKSNNRLTSAVEAGIQNRDYLYNTGFEQDTIGTSWIKTGPGNAAIKSTSETTNLVYPRTGQKLLKLYLASESAGTESCYQTVYLETGKTYVFSAYVNTACATTLGTGSGVYLDISGTQSERLTKKTNTAVDGGWQRLELSYTVPSNGNSTVVSCNVAVCSHNVKGIVVFDDLKLEQAIDTAYPTSNDTTLHDATASRENLLQLGSFDVRSSSGYSRSYDSQFWTYSSNEAAPTAECVRSGYSMTFAPSISAKRRATQVVQINESSASTYMISGWGYIYPSAFSDGSDMAGDNSGNKRFFGIITKLEYTDTSISPEYQYFAFCRDISGWQYISGTVIPKKENKTVSKITVILACDYSANRGYMDDIALTKEPVQTYRYDNDGNVISTAVENGKTSTTYDASKRLTGYTNMAGVSYALTYSGTSREPSTVTSDGVKTTYTYNDNGSVTNTRVRKSDNSGVYLESSITYSTDGNYLASTTDVNGNWAEYTYNTENNPEEDELNTGLLKTAATPYDDPDTGETRDILTKYEYDSNNNRLSSTVTDDLYALEYGYENGVLASISRSGQYNQASIQTQVYSMQTNAWGQTTQVKVGTTVNSGISLASYEYANNGGHMTKMTYGNGQYVKYYYDLFDRVVKEEYYNSSGALQGANHYVYNSEGVLTKQYATNANGVKSEEYRFEYDSLGRLIRSREVSGNITVQSTEHIYDTANRLTKQSWTLGNSPFTEQYTYNSNDGSLSTVTTPVGSTVNFDYDSLKRLTSQATVIGNNTLFTRRYSYMNYEDDPQSSRSTNRVKYYTCRVGDREDGTVLSGNEYVYDSSGNITQIKSNGIIVAAYSYDTQGQLLSETRGGSTFTYTYDSVGNIVSAVNGVNTVSYTYDDPQWHDRLTRIEFNDREHIISYDGSGNPLYWNNGTAYTNLTWEKGRQLVSLKKGTSTYTYAYDMDGIRKSKTVDGVTHSYITQNGKVVQESYGTKVLQFVYDTAGAPYALRYSTNSGASFDTYYYILNLQGDVEKLVNTSCATVASYTYDAWGKENSRSGSMANINPIRYRGYYYDTETGFYYLQSRYYDPMLGRFINSDSYASTGQGFLGCNMFAYCNNNPVNGLDPSGCYFIGERRYGNGLVECTDTGTSGRTQGNNDVLDIAGYDLYRWYISAYATHKKKGTVTPSNRSKHEKGEERRQRDQNGEKGDARRKTNRGNKRNHIEIEQPQYGFWDYLGAGAIIVGGTIGVVVLLSDDLTGVGVADDGYIVPLFETMQHAWVILFG